MAVIPAADYKLLVTDYETALTALVGISENYLNAANKVLLLNVFDSEIDLLVPFHNAYLVSRVSYSSQPQPVVDAVRALQRHVLSKGVDRDDGLKFTSIDEYYADETANIATGGEDFTGFFSTDFASLSQQAGFTIDSTYIV